MLHSNLITYNDPRSPVSEAYRMLRTNLHYLNVDKENKAILITSSKTTEGKTTTLCNLAITMAQARQKVVLVECDLRKPKIHTYFGINNDKGLMNILVEKTPIEEIIKEIEEVPDMFIIPSGPIPPNPAEVLESKAIDNLINGLKEKYDVVLIDAPPVCSVTDAAILSRLVDGVVLVTAAGETNVEAAKLAKKLLHKVNANILGTVLTKVNPSITGAYNYHYEYKEINKEEKKRKFKKNKKLA